jgi:hypothetical protein
LGFKDGELEMFFDMTDISEDELVRKYLDIAQHTPYNNLGTNSPISDIILKLL